MPPLQAYFQQIDSKYRCVRSVYYDKPIGSNWRLNYHQDLCVNVKTEFDQVALKNGLKRGGYYEVKAPIEILENSITARIHLDDCSLENGALHIIPGSHKKGIIDCVESEIKNEQLIELNEGEVLLMSPLLLHASGCNRSNKSRRIIHLEFSTLDLPWYERY